MLSNFVNQIVVFVSMSSFLYTLLGLSVSASLHCAVRKEIEPCTCRKEYNSPNIYVTCERMSSFEQIIHALENHFSTDHHITLEIMYSNLSDISVHTFQELKIPIVNLKLNHDKLKDVNDDSFLGLHKIDFLSLADNELTAFPSGILSRMPSLKSLDIGRGHITQILENDLANSKTLQHLFLPGNMIKVIEKNSLPKSLRHLHLGRNQIPNLNGTLKDLSELGWLFINANQMTSLEGQLPDDNKLKLIHASDNHMQHFPQEFKNLHRIEALFFEHNKLVGFDGTLRKAKRLSRLVVSHNNIMAITPDDFAEAESLEDLQMGYNNLTALNGSLSPLRSLRCVNLTHNSLTEFSLQEIRGLRRLRVVDLSNNKISKLIGRMENVVEWETRVMDIKLDYNELTSLDGALSGLHGLLYLNLSHNHLTRLSPDDLIGLEDLRWVDFSFNKLTTLDETSKTFLPSLERLIVTNNLLTELTHDFYGLPVLCWADLSYNNIRSISRDLVAHTRCNVHGSPAALRLLLEDNPVLCDSALPELISELEVNNTRLLGTSHCPPPLEITTTITTTALIEQNIDEMLNVADNNNSNVIEINAPPIIMTNATTNTQYLVEDISGDKSDNILPEIQHLETGEHSSSPQQKTVIALSHHAMSEDAADNPTKHVRAVD